MNGAAVTSGSASNVIGLNVGSNTITVVVTAQDDTTKTYTVTVMRESSSNADLSGLTLSSGTLNPTFGAGTTSYTASVGNSVSSLTVTPTVADPTATVTVNGASVASGSASNGIGLNVGSNTITVVVTAQDGTTTKTYTVTVTREAANSSSPSDGSSSGGPPSSGSPSTGNSQSGKTAGIRVIVSGKAYDQIFRGTTTNENGRSVLTVTVDAAKLTEQLAHEGDKPIIVISAASANAEEVRLALTGDAVKALVDKQAELEVQTLSGNYRLPASEIAIDRLSLQFGTQIKLEDIVVHVAIAKSDSAKAALVASLSDKGKFSVIVPPVDFTITVTYNGRTMEVEKFGSYVKREIPLPDSVAPGQITTAIVIDPDGSIHQVPTAIVSRSGKHYAVVSSLTNSTYALIWHPMTFVDEEGHWSKDAVNDMASRMIVNGVDEKNYRPDAAITRAEFTAILIRALGLSDKGKTSTFSDIQSSDWYVGAVAKAQEYGIVSGYEDGSFGSNKTITRQEAMVIIERAMKLVQLDTSINGADVDAVLAPFTDHSAVNVWAKQAVAMTVESGLVQGSDKRLKPTDSITRAETAAIVQRMLKKAKLIDSTNSR